LVETRGLETEGVEPDLVAALAAGFVFGGTQQVSAVSMSPDFFRNPKQFHEKPLIINLPGQPSHELTADIAEDKRKRQIVFRTGTRKIVFNKILAQFLDRALIGGG
jgi:hypothetical protein